MAAKRAMNERRGGFVDGDDMSAGTEVMATW
jgi:hypothetical protein